MARLEDAPSTHVEVHIDAPITQVWPLVCDIELPVRFSPELRGAEWLNEGPALGAKFRGHNTHPVIGNWTMTCTVTDYEPERTFGWSAGDVGDHVAMWRFDLAPQGESASTLRFTAQVGPGESGLSEAVKRRPEREDAIVENRLQAWNANMLATVEGIRAVAEGTHA